MIKLNHPNVIKFFGIYKDNENFLLCTEFAVGGSLDQFLIKRFEENKKLNEEELIKLAATGCKGMKYLESEKMVHRDLAAKNFLVDFKEEVPYLKVSDFGMSRSLQNLLPEKQYYKSGSSTDIVPFKWAAIEILEGKPGERRFTHKSDVWSFGVTLWEIANHCQKQPWEGIEWDGIIKRIKNGEKLEKGSISEEFYDIMSLCWEINPEKRPSFDQLSKYLKQDNSKATKEEKKKETKILSGVEEVCEWMKTLELSKDYSDLIRNNAIDKTVLKYMTDKQTWRDLGITAFGDLVKITSNIPK